MTVPAIQIPAKIKPDVTLTVEVSLTTNGTGQHIWSLNNQTHYANYNDPILLHANGNNLSSFDPHWNAYDLKKNKTIRIVMNTDYQSGHPMHLHGHSFVSLCLVSNLLAT